MLSLTTGSGRSRRDVLKIGGLGMGGLAWADLLARQGIAAPVEGSPVTGKTVIFLFMQGGPTQFETLDPKIDAPESVRTVGGVTSTSIPGVTFGENMPKLAGLAHRLAVVRSFQTGTQHGGLKPIVSDQLKGASIGATYSRVAGTNDRLTGLPTSVHLTPQAVDPKQKSLRDRFGRFDVTGPLGAAYAPFTPAGDGPFQENLKLAIEQTRLDDRRHLLSSLDLFRRQLDADGTLASLDGMRQQAFDMILKGVGQAFDISQESPETLARYETKQYFQPDLWKGKNNDPWYTAHTQTLGKLLVMARRLAEQGVGFITVNTEFVWDFHADGNNVACEQGRRFVIPAFDHAVSAFIEDCEARGLSDKILLVCCGEMGRTPKINKNGGRDHWPSLAPLMMYGGGITDGQIVGRSTRDGGQPDTEPLNTDNLLSNICHHLFDFGTVRLIRGLPSELLQAMVRIEQIPKIV